MAKVLKMPSHGHTAGIYADMSVDGPQIGTLVAVFDRAKNLPNRKTLGKQNPYCAARLGKEAKKTGTDMRGGQTPKWDQELRFTVHESLDYYQLKVSIFNDDKKTDLIGETWIDLKSLVIPGGGQSDQWHGLQFKGKYAGEIRIEMTYYDSRPEDEAIIGKRKEAAEKIQAKSNHSAAGSSSLSGPRQPKQVKRRPLPEDPTGSSSSRPAPPEHISPVHEAVPSTQSRSVGSEHVVSSPTHAAPPDSSYHPSLHVSSPPRSSRGHEPLDDLQRESAPVNARYPQDLQIIPRESTHAAPPDSSYHPSLHVSSPSRGHEPLDDLQRESAPDNARYPQDLQIIPRNQSTELHDSHFSQKRPHPDCDGFHQGEQGPKQHTKQDPYDYSLETVDSFQQRNVYDANPRPNGYQTVAPESSRYHIEPASYGQIPSNLSHSPTPSNTYCLSSAEVPSPSPLRIVAAPVVHRHGNPSPMNPEGFRESDLHRSVAGDDDRPSYASMQPSVEDEQDEALPPPPPVHRSVYNHANHDAGTLSYQPYSVDHAPSVPAREEYSAISVASPLDLALAPSGNPASPVLMTTNGQSRQSHPHDLQPNMNLSAMPLSLVAGYNASVTVAEPELPIYEAHTGKMLSTIPTTHMIVPYGRDSLYYQTPPLNSLYSTPTIEDRSLDTRSSIGTRERRSASPEDARAIRRKSISPSPSLHNSSNTPFSPDSYDALNPAARRSFAMRDSLSRPERTVETSRPVEPPTQDDVGPIITEDGRIVDPSDHLPTDTWAPEPEKKTKKPEVIIRFKHAPQSAPNNSRLSPRDRHLLPRGSDAGSSSPVSRSGRNNPRKSDSRSPPYGRDSSFSIQTSPPANTVSLEHEIHNGSSQQRNYALPRSYDSSQVRRRSASPTPPPYQTSSLYAPSNTGPPIPPKVPVASPPNQSYPSAGIDALSQEMQSIDIGS
ncbi:hypothetical protein Egran_04569, partial [Elaphomyces granulatus]